MLGFFLEYIFLCVLLGIYFFKGMCYNVDEDIF